MHIHRLVDEKPCRKSITCCQVGIFHQEPKDNQTEMVVKHVVHILAHSLTHAVRCRRAFCTWLETAALTLPQCCPFNNWCEHWWPVSQACDWQLRPTKSWAWAGCVDPGLQMNNETLTEPYSISHEDLPSWLFNQSCVSSNGFILIFKHVHMCLLFLLITLHE